MSTTLTLDKTGRVLLAERIGLTVQPDDQPSLAVAPSHRRVLPPSGRTLDAAAVTREERSAQASRRSAR